MGHFMPALYLVTLLTGKFGESVLIDASETGVPQGSFYDASQESVELTRQPWVLRPASQGGGS